MSHEVILLRHGETQGYHDDVGLTELGERQARDAGNALAARLPAAARIRLRHAPTARATATAVGLRAALIGAGREVGESVSDAHFDSLRFFHDGVARETSAVSAHRIAFDGEPVPDWVAEYDRFDTDFGAGAKLGGPIDRWMTATTTLFEPPQVVVYRAWAGVRGLAADAEPGSVSVVSTHSGLLRAVAAAAVGRDPGEPANLEEVRVTVTGDHARVGYREHDVVVEVPTTVPPWLDPAYLG